MEVLVCFLGDVGVGRDCLTKQYVQNFFQGDQGFDPSDEGDYRKSLTVGGKFFVLILPNKTSFDPSSPSQETVLQTCQGVLLLYSITNRASFDNVPNLFQTVRAGVHVILVATKRDLESERVVLKEEGQELANRICNGCFFETSAKTRENVEAVFTELCKTIQSNEVVRPVRCSGCGVC
jgi:GTPase SAR1 family protein